MKFFLLTLLLGVSIGAAEIPLSIGPGGHVELKRFPEGIVDMSISGPSPHFWSSVVATDFNPKKHTVLAFEYFSPSGISSFSVRYRQPGGEMVLGATQVIPLAETWQPIAFDLSEAEPDLKEADAKSRFHFSMKFQRDAAMQIRNLHLREPNESEKIKGEERAAAVAIKQTDADAILAYFQNEYPGRINEVVVEKESVVIRGFHEGKVHLRELRAPHPSHATNLPEGVIRKNFSGEFEISVPRFAQPNQRDRIHSRWRLESLTGEIASKARWGTIPADLAKQLAEKIAESQKGLGGIPNINDPNHEIFELGIQHATVNFVLSALLSDQPRRGNEKIMFEGRPYYLNRRFLQQREATVKHLCDNGIIVTAILLVGNYDDSSLTHPEAETRGVFAMPNLKNEKGSDLYRAALNVVANHFTQPDKRIVNWVIHNEVDQAGTWTNMGDQPLARYMETYHRSARLVYQTMRLRDPHTRVFISLTHHWAKRSMGRGAYTVKDMVELFAEMGRAEGDYEWGVAYHPYPQNLRNPDAWLDNDVTMSFDTPYITPKNFEVLPFYLQQSRFLYEGKPRGILFSEQGFNSPTLSEEDQRRQAAGLIYLFRHLPRFPVIEAFHLHRYKDMPDREGGLRLGIMDEKGNRKIGWEAYRTLGTPQGREYEAMADDVIRETSQTNAIGSDR